MDAICRILAAGRDLAGEFPGLARARLSFGTSLCFAVLLALIHRLNDRRLGRRWPYAATALLAFGGFFTVEGRSTSG